MVPSRLGPKIGTDPQEIYLGTRYTVVYNEYHLNIHFLWGAPLGADKQVTLEREFAVRCEAPIV